MKKILLLVLSWILILLAVLLGIVCAIVGFLGTAYFVNKTILLCTAAIILCLTVSFGLAWIGGGKIAPSWRNRFALAISAGTCVFVVLVSILTFFKPLVAPSEIGTRTPPPQTQFWDLPTGSRIAYIKIPAIHKTNPEPIIYIHGGPGVGIIDVKPITDFFSSLAQEGYDVYFYDQVGGGFSARLENIREYSHSRNIADLESIRQKIGSTKVILIGESYGGMLTAYYTAIYPENVKKCVFISPGELNPEEWEGKDRGYLKDRASPEKLEEFNNLLRPRVLLIDVLLDINPDAAYNFIPENEADSFATKLVSLIADGIVCDPTNMPKGLTVSFGLWANQMLEEHSSAPDIDLSERLQSTRIPALILKGECDYVKWEVTYQYKTMFPHANLLYLEDAGHMSYLEKPDLVMDAIRAFLLDEPLPLPAYTDSSPPQK